MQYWEIVADKLSAAGWSWLNVLLLQRCTEKLQSYYM